MSIEDQKNKVQGAFKKFVLAETKDIKNPLGFLKIIGADIKNALAISQSKSLRFYYGAQLEVVESLILNRKKTM